MIGKRNRLARILGRDHRALIVPVDQSITSGPIDGLADMATTIREIVDGRPDALIMHRGPVAAGLWAPEENTCLIVHLSAGTQLSDDPMVKTGVCGVEHALTLGADAVSVHISLGLGGERDNAALAEFGKVSSECHRWGMPLLAMMYVYGESSGREGAIAHAARIGCDLGADLIKVNYPGCFDAFAHIVKTSYVPIVVAGGPCDGDGREILRVAEEALRAGAAGVCIGRNIYQHAHPTAMVRAVRGVVHERMTADEAFDQYIPGKRFAHPEGLNVVTSPGDLVPQFA